MSGRRARRKGKMGDFIAIPRDVMRSEAFKRLKPMPRAVLLQLAFAFDGKNNGRIRFSVREAKDFGLGRSPTAEALKVLKAAGFIATTREGGFAYGRKWATEWRITWLETSSMSATNDFDRRIVSKPKIPTVRKTARCVRKSGLADFGGQREAQIASGNPDRSGLSADRCVRKSGHF